MIPLPLRDDNPTYRTPYVTIALILVNVAVWIYEILYPADPRLPRLRPEDLATLDYGAIPSFILHGVRDGYVQLGRLSVPWHQEAPFPLTVLTSMFLHGSWLHIIGNMWFLWIFGDNIEDAMGSVRYVFFYLICGLAAAMAQILATPNSATPMVGASGAIAGVLGGYLLLFPHARVKCLWILIIFITTISLPAWLLLGLWFLSQFLVPMGSGVAWMAHVGGFLAGLGLVRLFARSRPLRPRRIGPGVYDFDR